MIGAGPSGVERGEGSVVSPGRFGPPHGGESSTGGRTFPRLMSLRDHITPCNGADAPETRGHDGAGRFRVDVQPEPHGARVRPLGEIDLATVDDVRRKIDESVAGGCERVVLDLGGVTFMDSNGLHLALDADTDAREGGGQLLIIDGPGPVQRIFDVTGLRDRLPFVDPSLTQTGTRP
jgi:anti-sigma B factor antagonist